MHAKEGNIVLCGLCGQEIEAPKGVRSGTLGREQQQGRHDSCIKKQYEILARYGIDPNAELLAKISGLLELHPEVERSKPVMEYRNRAQKAKEDLYKAFPYLRKPPPQVTEQDELEMPTMW